MIPYYALQTINKAQILTFLALPRTFAESKKQLLLRLQTFLETNPHELARLLDTYPLEVAVGPSEAQQLLGCSAEERKRWINEGKIPILGYRTVSVQGIRYPVHDRRLILSISLQDVQQWRTGCCMPTTIQEQPEIYIYHREFDPLRSTRKRVRVTKDNYVQ